MTDSMITLVTSDHGPVTFAEPAWCTRGSHHGPQADPAPRRSEISHQGDPFTVTVPTPGGTEVLLELALWADAFPEPHWPFGEQVHALVSLRDVETSSGVAGLDALADAMQDAARQIHRFANRLALELPRDGGR